MTKKCQCMAIYYSAHPVCISCKAWCLQGWCVLCGTKMVLGFWLKGAAGAYLRHFERRQKKTAARIQVSRSSVAGEGSKITKKE